MQDTHSSTKLHSDHTLGCVYKCVPFRSNIHRFGPGGVWQDEEATPSLHPGVNQALCTTLAEFDDLLLPDHSLLTWDEDSEMLSAIWKAPVN